MRIREAFAVGLIRFVSFFIVRLDATELEKLPKKGPFILAMNHVNGLDGPLLLSRLFPRRVASLAKRETWDNPILGFFVSAVGGIPVDRGGGNPEALRRVALHLGKGGFLYINPEGTRSRDGVLRKGKAGVVAIALRTLAPVVPVAFEGLENFGSSIRRLRRTKAILHVGAAFGVSLPEDGKGREGRQAAITEIMFRIAALLPESKRGEYAGAPPAEWRYTSTIRLS